MIFLKETPTYQGLPTLPSPPLAFSHSCCLKHLSGHVLSPPSRAQVLLTIIAIRLVVLPILYFVVYGFSSKSRTRRKFLPSIVCIWGSPAGLVGGCYRRSFGKKSKFRRLPPNNSFGSSQCRDARSSKHATTHVSGHASSCPASCSAPLSPVRAFLSLGDDLCPR